MDFSKRLLLFLAILPLAFSQEFEASIIEIPETKQCVQDDDDVRLQCAAWRVAGEANNLSPWKVIPSECGDYVRDYMSGKGYDLDLQMVSNEAGVYAKGLNLSGDGKDAWIFDIDETLLSNLPYYADHGHGCVLLSFYFLLLHFFVLFLQCHVSS